MQFRIKKVKKYIFVIHLSKGQLDYKISILAIYEDENNKVKLQNQKEGQTNNNSYRGSKLISRILICKSKQNWLHNCVNIEKAILFF